MGRRPVNPRRVTWNGVNMHAVCKVCRSLVRRNTEQPTSPGILFHGRSRVEPESNTVSIWTGGGYTAVRFGDTIVRHAGDTYTVEPADVP